MTSIEEIARRLQAASPGPWVSAEQSDNRGFGIQDQWSALGLMFGREDGEFVAHAREDIAYLLDLIETWRQNETVTLHESGEITLISDINEAIDKGMVAFREGCEGRPLRQEYEGRWPAPERPPTSHKKAPEEIDPRGDSPIYEGYYQGKRRKAGEEIKPAPRLSPTLPDHMWGLLRRNR